MSGTDRVEELKEGIALFPEELDGRVAEVCYSNSETGEYLAFTYGDLRALVNLADAVRKHHDPECWCPICAALARLDDDVGG